ncbi:Protein kinase [Hondaea fermentalgiana]|uniref:Protein kinase n=1 Tax=Hondaea fermentalgiana TaxID=2315210 RepID=A0A2R5G7X9_9STRA|nr:Protein kinase [Hondaea fermentalgiana]|eukprot:GBG27147.1 Protein kinase [Hondaea fermentalgiana]
MHRYKLLAKKGEGTFSEVIRAKCLTNNREVAIKVMRNKFESLEQVNSLREIQALRRLSPDAGIIKLYEVLFDDASGRLALVFELMQMNLYELIRGRKNFLPEAQIKSILYQVLRAVDRMHRNSIFHRDLKPENILVTPQTLGGGSGVKNGSNPSGSKSIAAVDPVAAGNNLLVKVADFGSCRGIYSKQPYTEYIATRWYRAPECLLTSGYYSFRMDLWAIGCIAFEIIALFPLFPGTNELDQIERIHNVLGTPGDEILGKFKRFATHIDFNFSRKKGTGIGQMIPHVDTHCVDLIEKLLAYDPEERMSARQALRHPYFRELRHADKKRERAAKASKGDPQERAGHHNAGADAGAAARRKNRPPRGTKANRHDHAGGSVLDPAARAAGGVGKRKDLPRIQHPHHGAESMQPVADPRHPVALPSLAHGKHRGQPQHPGFQHHQQSKHHHESSLHGNAGSTTDPIGSNNNGRLPPHQQNLGHPGHAVKSTKTRRQNPYGPIMHGANGGAVPIGGKTKRLGAGQGGHNKKYGHSKSSNPAHKVQYSAYKSSYQSPYSQKYLARSRIPGAL